MYVLYWVCNPLEKCRVKSNPHQAGGKNSCWNILLPTKLHFQFWFICPRFMVYSFWIFLQSSLIQCGVFISLCLGRYYICCKIPSLIHKSLCYSESGTVCTAGQVWQTQQHWHLKVKKKINQEKKNPSVRDGTELSNLWPCWEKTRKPRVHNSAPILLTLWRWVLCGTASQNLWRVGLEKEERNGLGRQEKPKDHRRLSFN